MVQNSKLKDLGYNKTEIKAIRERNLTRTLIDNQWYSEYLAACIEDGTVNEDYLELYTAVTKERGLTDDDLLLASRLMEIGYENDQLDNLYQNLEFFELTPLLTFDYQWNETAYIEDCVSHRDTNSVDSFTLSEEYYKKYKITNHTEHEGEDLMIVNRNWYLSSTFVPDNLAELSSQYSVPDQKLAKQAAEAFTQFAADANLEGVYFFATTTYRSYETQETIYNGYVNSYGEEGADNIALRPGYTEHQTGLAVNVAATYEGSKAFQDSDTYAWMKANCVKYGFIERYPANKETITGMDYEPDHYRYLGQELAQAVADSHLTYDEFYALYIKGWETEEYKPDEALLKKTMWNYETENGSEDTSSTPTPTQTAEAEAQATATAAAQ